MDKQKEVKDIETNDFILNQFEAERMLAGYSNIWLRDDYKLITFLISGRSGGYGSTFVLPRDRDPLDFIEVQDKNNPENTFYRFKDALDSFILAVEGDKSPLSYLQAALAYQDIREYGSQWHYVRWARDILLPTSIESEELEKYRWNMLEKEPESFLPHFYYDEKDNPTIVFYTINDIVDVEIREYICTFPEDNYRPQIKITPIAEAGMGVIF